ncbi:hypothetical protein T4D_10969 [Trichinella pseudospiralis]|uniref:Major sperm protein n=2 Tax=Trichinella pseudospiralis TaxID=6337 RepID=A0A0V1G6L6_TRIPS|nr:hypothetical protein T4D_10969 [Trichinella pseudospiralis]
MSDRSEISSSPTVLDYVYPADHQQRAVLKIKNESDLRLALKIKTTNNSCFKVSFVYAVLEPRGEKKLTVWCAPIPEDFTYILVIFVPDVFPDGDILEPETESDEKDLLDLVPHESVTSDDCSEDDTPELQKKWEKRDLAVQNIAYKRRFESEERTSINQLLRCKITTCDMCEKWHARYQMGWSTDFNAD